MGSNKTVLGLFAVFLATATVGCGQSFQTAGSDGLLSNKVNSVDGAQQTDQSSSQSQDSSASTPAPAPTNDSSSGSSASQQPATSASPVVVKVEVDPNEIKALYVQVLGRDFDQAGLDFWVAKAEDGMSIADIRVAFANSLEARGLLRKLYVDILKREPDAAGLKFWTDQLGKTLSLADVRKFFANSDEAKALIAQIFQKHLARAPQAAEIAQAVSKLSASVTMVQIENSVIIDLVSATYRQVLGRNADLAGLMYWTERVQGGLSAADLRKAFASSDEAKRLVTNLYINLLTRLPDQGGLDFFIGQLANGVSLSDIRKIIANSDEAKALIASYYKNHLARLPSAAETNAAIVILVNGQNMIAVEDSIIRASNSDRVVVFVRGLYLSALGRKADAGGFDFWVNHIRANKSVATIAGAVRTFMTSPEFKARPLTQSQFLDVLYVTALGRNADSGGKAFWLDQLDKGMTRDTVIDFFVNTDEAKARYGAI